MKSKIDPKDAEEKLQRGFLILDAFLKENGGLPTPELFRGCWQLILGNEELFWGAATRSNKFNVDGRNLVYARFALFFKLLRKEFVPPVRLANESLGLSVPPGSIFVALHSQLETAIAKFLQSRSHQVAMITAGPAQPQLLELFALSPVPEYIKRSSDCLLLAREALAKSKSLLLVVDYRIFDEARQQYLYKIGVTAFRFAKKVAKPLYFVKPEINAEGEIVCTIRLSDTAEPENEIAGQFRSFAGSDLPIGDWFSDTGGKLNAVIPAHNPPG